MRQRKFVLLIIMLFGLYACAAPCTWEGETCMELDLSGEGTLHGAVLWLGLSLQGAAQRGNLPAELELPTTITLTLPVQVAARDVQSVRICGQDAAATGFYAGSVPVHWVPGSRSVIDIPIQPSPRDECTAVVPTPQPMPPAQPIPDLRLTSRRTNIQGLAPLTGAALGDFYDNRHPDLAVVGLAQSAILLFPALGDGSFGQVNIFPQARVPDKLLVTDLDQDGHGDLLGPSRKSGIILSYASTGKGSLAAGFGVAFSSMGAAPADLVMADLTGDRKAEAIVANATSPGEVIVFPIGGKITAYPAGTTAPDTIAVADMDGDGWNDIVVASRSAGLVVLLLNDRTGTMLTGPKIAQCTGPVALDIADYDGDHRRDLAVLCQSDHTLQILFANPAGSAEHFTAATVLTVEDQPRFLVSGDFNHDGQRDLAVLHDSGSLVFQLGVGSRSFTSRRWTDTFGRNPSALLTDDLNGDGRSDLLVIDELALTSLLSN